MTRWKASFIHLLVSFAVISTIAAYIIYFWYPPALMHMAKADRLLYLVGGIDLVAGPLLTLIVYKHGKPSLRFDLSFIAVLQAAFLSMGLHTMFISRPVFLVASPTMFDMVFANDILPSELAKAKDPRFQSLGFTRPQLVGAKLPTNPEERHKLALLALSGGSDLQMLPQYYVDYSVLIPELLANAHPLQTSKDVSENEKSIMVEAANAYGRQPDDLRFLRLGSARGFAVMLIDAKTGAVVGPANVDP